MDDHISLGQRKHIYELENEPKEQPNRVFTCKELAIKVIMDCKATAAHKFRTRLGFKGENMQTQYNVLGYRIDLYFHDSKLAIKTDENGQSDRHIDHEIKRQKVIEEKPGCEFIRTDPGRENLNIFEAIKKVFRHIKLFSNQLTKQSTKKALIEKNSM